MISSNLLLTGGHFITGFMKVLIEYLGIKEAGPIISIGVAKGLLENGIEVYAILSNEIENKQDWQKILSNENLFFIKTTPKKNRIVASSFSFVSDCLSIYRCFHGITFDYVIKTFLVLNDWDRIVCKFVSAKRDLNMIHDPIPHSSMNINEARKYRKIVAKSNEIIVLSKKFIPVIQEQYGIDKSRIFYMRLGQMSLNNIDLNFNKIRLKDSINYLFFGRIDGYKGLHVLAKAYKTVSDRYQNKISLTIAGNGNFENYKEEYDSLKNVQIINRYIDDKDVCELFLRPRTVLVLPYLDATQSGVIPLAIQYGVPVIASDTGGLKEQLDFGKLGTFFETGNSQELSSQMEKFLVDEELYSTEQKKMIHYSKMLSWNIVTKELLDELKGGQVI